ncbi:Protein CBG07180 [Caenorhabditis briggsae]|uniref:Protein CBG07180 n=1 Tax=Caenorhabditis briggsae TaxID=6238 RepID=A8X3J0_CAEBR|nr:Protein CBG07180 [Caenorhabditis briggsae]CAP27200.1 Protein CBG07180 [Caenorhabditis briggsae]
MSNTEIFNCKACSKSFASKKGLNQHSSIHSSDGPAFQCEFCSKTFKYKSNLYEHLSVHTVSEPYSCPYCDKKTKLKGNFKKHLATHFTDKSLLDEVWAPYASHKKYEKCGNRRSEVPKHKEHQSTVPQNVFHQPSNFHLYQNFHDPCINTIGKLIDSVKSIELERYHCSICCYEFARKADCIFHYQYFHPNLQMELFCHICLRTFPNQEEFQKHVEYHRTTSRVLQNSRTITSPKFYIPTGEEILTALNSGWHQQPATYF